MNKSINLYPTPPAEWLWRDHADDIKREFFPSVTIPSTDEPLWHECTSSEKEQYELIWDNQHQEHLEHNARVQEEQEKANFEQNL